MGMAEYWVDPVGDWVLLDRVLYSDPKKKKSGEGDVARKGKNVSDVNIGDRIIFTKCFQNRDAVVVDKKNIVAILRTSL